MPFPATGRKVAMPASMVQEVRDGRIVAVDHDLGLLTLPAQIGAVPGG